MPYVESFRIEIGNFGNNLNWKFGNFLKSWNLKRKLRTYDNDCQRKRQYPRVRGLTVFR